LEARLPNGWLTRKKRGCAGDADGGLTGGVVGGGVVALGGLWEVWGLLFALLIV